MIFGGKQELRYPPDTTAKNVKKINTVYNTAFAAAFETSKPMITWLAIATEEEFNVLRSNIICVKII